MYKIAFIFHTSLEVTSMYISLNVDFEINSLSELPKFKQMMVHKKMKINKSKLEEGLEVDSRTVDRFLIGFVPKRTRKRIFKIDEYYEKIAALLLEDSKQVFYYRLVFWKYLKDDYGLECGVSTFRAYIAHTFEF